MAIFAKKLMAQSAFVENLESILIQVKNAIFGGARFNKNVQGQLVDNGASLPGFSLDKDGILKASRAEISGHIEADSGFFHGELEAGPLLVNTETLLSSMRSYSNGTDAKIITANELGFWGLSVSAVPVSITKQVSGSYGAKNIEKIYFNDQGRAGVVNFSGITFYFTDGSNERVEYGTNIAANLSFRYKTEGWNVRLVNLPESDPKIAGVLWKNGSNIVISSG